MKRIFSVIISVFALSIFSIPSAMAADTSPPQLVDWGIAGGYADISKSDATVTVRFILSDESGIPTPNLLLKSLSTTQMTSFATVKELSRSGKLVSYEATATIKVGQSPRIWEWVLYPLRDSVGNASVAFGPGGTWVSQINVLDGIYTGAVLSCERNVNFWNRLLERLEDAERKFPDAQELAIFRLKKVQLPNRIETSSCPDVKYPDPNYTTDIYNSLMELIDSLTIAALEKAEAAADKAAADKTAADKTAAELKAKQEADAKAVADKAAATKKTTIVCVKGKLIKKVTAIKPVCPKGYKKK